MRAAWLRVGQPALAAAAAVAAAAAAAGAQSHTHADSHSGSHPPTFGAASTVRHRASSAGGGDHGSSAPSTSSRTTSDLSSLILMTGSSHRALADEISGLIGVPVAASSIGRFADGEVSIQVNTNMRGNDVFIVQSCAAPVNDSIMELLLTVSCARRSGAKRVIAVIPYFGYKHHRRGSALSTKYQSRFLSSGAMDFAKMLQEMGVDRVISVDLQRPGQGQEACFFDTAVPLEVVLSNELMVKHLLSHVDLAKRVVIVAPNAEGFKKARKFQVGLQKAHTLPAAPRTVAAAPTTAASTALAAAEAAKPTRNFQLATFVSSESSGSGPVDTTKLELLGDNVQIAGADVLIVDDMVDTAGTLSDLSRLLKAAGALNIYVVASHGLFTDNSMELIENSAVSKVFVTNSLPLPRPDRAVVSSKVEQVSLAPHLGHIILAEYFRTLNTAKEEEFREEWEGMGAEDEIE